MDERISKEMLSAYLDGELSPDECSRVEATFADDPNWRQMVEDLRSIRFNLNSLPRFTLGEDFYRRVLEAAMRAESQRHSLPEAEISADGTAASVSAGPEFVVANKFQRQRSRTLMMTALSVVTAAVVLWALLLGLQFQNRPPGEGPEVAVNPNPIAPPVNPGNRFNAPRVEPQSELRPNQSSTSENRVAEDPLKSLDSKRTERIRPKPRDKPVQKLPDSTSIRISDANPSNARIDAPDATEMAPDQEVADQPLNKLFATNDAEMEEGQVEQTAHVIRTEIRGEIIIELDIDRNGLITDREAGLAARSLQRAVIEARGTERGQLLLRLIDTNSNGQADQIELIHEIARLRKKTPGLGASVAEAFSKLDKDQDEFISAAEFQEQIKQLGRRGKPLKPRVARLFQLIDFDRDMRISVAESQMGAEVFANLLAIQVQP